jgi:hypothetical protein
MTNSFELTNSSKCLEVQKKIISSFDWIYHRTTNKIHNSVETTNNSVFSLWENALTNADFVTLFFNLQCLWIKKKQYWLGLY